MGNEGQESPRDVASEKQKHPWEVFPEGVTSTENGGKKREKTDNKKEKGKGFKLPKNKPLIIGAVVLVVLVGVGIFFGVKFLTEKKAPENNNGPESEVIASSKESTSIDEAATPELAYAIAATALRDAALEGVNVNGTLDTSILMDNIENFVKKQKKESDRTYYNIIAVSITSLLEETDVAEQYLKEVDKLDYDDLDVKQKYAFFIAHRLYYRFTDNDSKYKEYDEWFDKEFPDDVYVSAGTNNKVEPSEEEKK